jgi:GT2 family glycosyltransferase
MVNYQSWDVLLVDQSDDGRTRHVAQELSRLLPNLSYRHMKEKGQSRACNIGIEASSGEIIAFLHDDCTMESDWLEQISSAFERWPRAALVFGTVKSAPTNPNESFTPVYPVEREQLIRGRRAFVRPDGMGATMYLRRAVVERVGLFDACLGPGSQFTFGGEDNDYIYRCLVAGYSVARTPTIVLEHYGARSYANGDAARLFRNYAYSAGITDMKLLRTGHRVALVLMASHLTYFILEMLRHGPGNIDRLGMYLRGLHGSFQLEVDSRRHLFVQRHIELPAR